MALSPVPLPPVVTDAAIPAGAMLTLLTFAGVVVQVTAAADGSGPLLDSWTLGSTVYAPEGSYLLRYPLGSSGSSRYARVTVSPLSVPSLETLARTALALAVCA